MDMYFHMARENWALAVSNNQVVIHFQILGLYVYIWHLGWEDSYLNLHFFKDVWYIQGQGDFYFMRQEVDLRNVKDIKNQLLDILECYIPSKNICFSDITIAFPHCFFFFLEKDFLFYSFLPTSHTF